MGGKNTAADGVRPIFLPSSLGFSSVLAFSAAAAAAAVIVADIIDPSNDGPIDATDATDGGLLTTDGSNPNILPNALR